LETRGYNDTKSAFADCGLRTNPSLDGVGEPAPKEDISISTNPDISISMLRTELAKTFPKRARQPTISTAAHTTSRPCIPRDGTVDNRHPAASC